MDTQEQIARMSMAQDALDRANQYGTTPEKMEPYYIERLKTLTDFDMAMVLPMLQTFAGMGFDFVIDPILRNRVETVIKMDLERFNAEIKRRGIPEEKMTTTVFLTEEEAAGFRQISPEEAIMLNEKNSKQREH